jgi:hypothetical protein
LVSDAVPQAVISPPSLDQRVGALLEIARRVWMVIPKRLAARRSQKRAPQRDLGGAGFRGDVDVNSTLGHHVDIIDL